MDQDLRKLLRTWQQSGNGQDQLAWITAARRASQLSRVHLRVAAWCGDEIARDALGVSGLKYEAPKSGVEVFLAELPANSRTHPRIWLRASAAVQGHLLPEYGDPTLKPTLESIVEVARQESDAPSEPGSPTRTLAGEAAQALAKTATVQAFESDYLTTYRTASPTDLLTCSLWSLATAVHTGDALETGARLPLRFVEDRKVERALRAAVCAVLVPWVLTLPATSPDEDEHRHAWLFPFEEITPDAARAVLAATDGGTYKGKAPKPDVGAAALRAYCLASGWTQKRVALLHPTNKKVKLKLGKRVVAIEEGGPGKWEETGTFPLRGLGRLLLQAATRCVE